MEEVTIKLTLEEAQLLRNIIKNKIDESYGIAAILKNMEGNAPGWMQKQIRNSTNLYDKIDAAINASY